jgi:phosphoribosylformimino-5-aminoimidazole carboxamide ribotide isomerase
VIVYPAIDLLGGRCVRLRQGDYARATVFDADPLDAAARWQTQGAEWLHLVDLDGARDGRPAHLEVLRQVAAATGLPIQFGGGLRTLADVAAALAAGAARVILGTAALADPALLATSLARWSERIAVAVDARAGRIAVDGWRTTTAEDATDFARRLAHLGVRTLIYTDVERDGTLVGSNAAALARLHAVAPEVAWIVAGGVGTVEDVRRLAVAGAAGVVLGRALYEGTVALPVALAAASGAPSPPRARPAEAPANQPSSPVAGQPARREDPC